MSLGIYIQVPFCQTKCTYCNFHTGPASRTMYAPYVLAAEQEIRQRARLVSSNGAAEGGAPAKFQAVDTIYLGGGTPSLLAPSGLSGILTTIRDNFAFLDGEVTLEADPETIDAEKAAPWRAAGINRISLGAQSFRDTELIAAGRMHRREDIF